MDPSLAILANRHRLSLGLDGWKGPPGVDFYALLAADRWIAVLQWLDGLILDPWTARRRPPASQARGP